MMHQNMLRLNVEIRNMKSKEQMQNENNIYQILSMLPTGNQFILNGVGKITKWKNQNQNGA